MMRTMLWKEYREQRGLWLGLAALGLGLSFGLGMTLPPGGLAGLAQDHETGGSIMVLLLSFSIGYPLVCGAMQLAGEREGGTWDFLHYTASDQRQVWRGKVGAGLLLTLGLTLLFGGLVGTLNLPKNPAARWSFLAIFPFLGLDAWAWGLLASAWCRSVMGAVLSAIGLWALSWMLSIGVLTLVGTNLGFFIENGVIKVALASLALVLSFRRYCRDEFDQQALAGTKRRRPPSSIGVLVWLMVRQGRIELAVVALLAIVGGGLLGLQQLVGWPLLSVGIGLICGFTVFGHERARGEEHYLGMLRLPPGAWWTIKVGWWFVVLGAALTVAYALGYLMILTRSTVVTPEHLFSRVLGDSYLTAYWFQWPVFVTLWPIHGFAFGVTFGLVFRRTILAVLLGSLECLLVLGLWSPSLVCGGVATWQLFVIPVIMLVYTRLTMWPWISGRLLTGSSRLGIVVVELVSVGFLAGCLWYRAVEIPDEGEPFDVAAYRAELDAAAKSPAGDMLRKAAADFKAWQHTVDEEIGPAAQPLVWKTEEPKDEAATWEKVAYSRLIYQVRQKGWPAQEGKLGAWLDRMMAGPWYKELQQALTLEPGLLDDPRHFVEPKSPQFHPRRLLGNAGELILVRSQQRHHQNKMRPALDDIDLALALARQLWRHVPSISYLDGGFQLQISALHDLERWSQKVGSDEAMIRQALTIVQRQEQAQPTSLELRRGLYLIVQKPLRAYPDYSEGRLDQGLYYGAVRAPWEQERRRRIINETMAAPDEVDYVDQAWKSRHALQALIADELPSRTWWRQSQLTQLRGLQLQFALMLYQLDHGHAAATLEDVTPRYLPELPLNARVDEPFHYRISDGEDFEDQVLGITRLEPGQGLLWATGRHGHDFYYVVPVLKK